MNQKDLIKYFKGKQIPYSIIAKHIGVSTKTVYNWFDKEKLKHTSYVKLLEYYKKLNANAERNLTVDQQNMLIEYQKNEIQQLKNEVAKNDAVYNGIHSDIVFAFEIKFNWSLKRPGVKVKYLSQDSSYIPTMAKKLGYTESEIIEILQIDEFVEYKKHKIHQLRTEEQKKEMLGVMDNFMNAYRNIKMNTTMLVAEIPVLYTHKNGSTFKSNVEYRVNWIKGTGTAHIRWCNE